MRTLETDFNEILKAKQFHSTKCIGKCVLRNYGTFFRPQCVDQMFNPLRAEPIWETWKYICIVYHHWDGANNWNASSWKTGARYPTWSMMRLLMPWSIALWHWPRYLGFLQPWPMMTSSNENFFRVTGHLCGEFTGCRWIPRTNASDAELWCFLWSAPAWGWWFETPSHYDVTVMLIGFMICSTYSRS